MDIEQHGPGCVGVIRRVGPAAGGLPDQPCIDGAEEQVAPCRHLPGAIHILQNPGGLRRGEIRVRQKSRLILKPLCQPPLLQLRAKRLGSAALPDDGGVHRLPRGAVPGDQRFPLVGDSDTVNLVRADVHLVQKLSADARLLVPDLLRILLHPARMGIRLPDLLLAHSQLMSVLVEHQRAYAGGAGIQC